MLCLHFTHELINSQTISVIVSLHDMKDVIMCTGMHVYERKTE